MMEEARQLRDETSSLVGDYLDLEKKFRDLRVVTKETMKEVEQHNQNLDEVIYLNKVMRHLKDADNNMQYVPCVVYKNETSR